MRRYLLSVPIAALAVLLAACGNQACACYGIGTMPATHLSLSARENGQHFWVNKGTTIDLALENSFGPPGSSLTWSASSSNPSVVSIARSSVEPKPSGRMLQGTQVYFAEFEARGDGEATISAQGHRTCEAMNPKSCPQASYSVTVTVTG